MIDGNGSDLSMIEYPFRNIDGSWLAKLPLHMTALSKVDGVTDDEVILDEEITAFGSETHVWWYNDFWMTEWNDDDR